jgi:LacI family transcriptional regulator
MAEQPSIIDVAERAGVSVATASRVISNVSYPVRETTRQKVLHAAAELGYTPNSLAQNFRSQRSKLLAVLVGDNADPYFAEVTRGVEEVANEQGYLTIVCNTDRNPAKELHYLRTLRDYRVDGILFAGGGLQAPGYPEQLDTLVKQMTKRGTAIMTLAQHALHAPSVQPDNFGGARRMTERLIELGHRRIAFISGPSNLIVANLRLQGYMAAMIEAGVPIDPTLILAGNFDQSSGEQAAISVSQMPDESRPTALFGANDETALGVLHRLTLLAWHIPNDISVCGFGDIPMSQIVTPALTTVQIGLRQLGRTGTQKLLALLRHESVPSLEMIPTTLIERDTTAPPARPLE